MSANSEVQARRLEGRIKRADDDDLVLCERCGVRFNAVIAQTAMGEPATTEGRLTACRDEASDRCPGALTLLQTLHGAAAGARRLDALRVAASEPSDSVMDTMHALLEGYRDYVFELGSALQATQTRIDKKHASKPPAAVKAYVLLLQLELMRQIAAVDDADTLTVDPVAFEAVGLANRALGEIAVIDAENMLGVTREKRLRR